MKVKSIMRIVFLTIGLGVIATSFLVFRLNALVAQMQTMADVRYQSYQAADELRQSSDELTRLGRTYAVTGNEKYEKMYLDVLSIRNGEKPRPINYHTIYWDLVLNYGDKPKADGKLEVLKDRMKSLGFTESEFQLLAQSQANSDGLVHMEVEAMNAVKGVFADKNGVFNQTGTPDPQSAIDLLHSEEYHQEKAKIMQPIDEFFVQLEERTQNQLNSATDQVVQYVKIGTALMLIVLIMAITGYFMVFKMVTLPISSMSKKLNDIDEANDLQQRVDVLSTNEIGSIGLGINGMLESYQSTVQKIRDVNEAIKQTSQQIKSVSEDSANKSYQQNLELDMAATAMEEMTMALASVSESTLKAENHAAESEKQAEQGLEVFNNTQNEFVMLFEEFSQTAKTIDELAVESNNVGNVLEVIKAIAEQTNLLALNAAIEAARAGEQGRGFAVVADEVRTLAQRTQESTIEIETMISSLQVKAERSTKSIKQSSDKMIATRDNLDSASASLGAIQKSAMDIHELNSIVASATEEQLAVGSEISGNICNIKDLSHDMNEQVKNLMQVVESLTLNTGDLNSTIEHFKVS